MKYKILEEIATADVAFETEGTTLNELFENAAFATSDIMVDVKSVEPKITKTIRLMHRQLDFLLFDLLAEIIYLKDAETILFSNFKVEITKHKEYELKATLIGDNINSKQEMRNDVKAVTMHMFKIENTKKGFKATIILDL
jgi:SHS2 domain-containing protein